MRKMGRKKARVSSHLNPQMPNFSITNQNALIFEPILGYASPGGFHGWKKEAAVPWRSPTAIYTCFVLFPLDVQGPTFRTRCYSVLIYQEVEESYSIETAHLSLRSRLSGRFPFLHQNLPWLLRALFILQSPAQSIFWFL